MEDLTSVLHVVSFAMQSGSATKKPPATGMQGVSWKDNKGFKKSLQENPGRGLM